MDALERLVKKQLDSKRGKPSKSKYSGKKTKRKGKRKVFKEEKYPFYILHATHRVNGTAIDNHYAIVDKYFHYTWATSSDEDSAKESLIDKVKRYPSFEDINSAIKLISSRDLSGYTGMFISRFKMDEVEFEEWWRSRDTKSRSGFSPPKHNWWVYEQIQENGKCEYIKGVTHTLLDISDLKDRFKEIRIKELVARAKKRRVNRVVSLLKHANTRKKNKEFFKELEQKSKRANPKLQERLGPLAGLFRR